MCRSPDSRSLAKASLQNRKESKWFIRNASEICPISPMKHIRIQKLKCYQALGKWIYSKYGNHTPECTGATCALLLPELPLPAHRAQSSLCRATWNQSLDISEQSHLTDTLPKQEQGAGTAHGLPGPARALTCSKASWSSMKHNWSAIWNLVFHGLNLHHSAIGQRRAGEWEPWGSKRRRHPYPPQRHQQGAEGWVPSEIAWLGLKDQLRTTPPHQPTQRLGQRGW